MAVYDDIGTREHVNETCDVMRRLLADADCETIGVIAQGAAKGYEQEMTYYRSNLANALFWQAVDETRWADDLSRTNAETLHGWAQDSLRRAGVYLSLVHLLDDGER